MEKVINESAKDRLIKFLSHLGIGQGKFESIVGISNGYINNNKGSIGAAILKKISAKYPELNIDWVISGDGDMIKPEIPEEKEEYKYKDKEKGDRINEVLKYLIYNFHSSASRHSISKDIGLKNPHNINMAINGDAMLADKIINLLVVKYPFLNKEWLLTGEGSMVNEDIENYLKKDRKTGGSIQQVKYDDLQKTVNQLSIANSLLVIENNQFKKDTELLRKEIARLNEELKQYRNGSAYGKSANVG